MGGASGREKRRSFGKTPIQTGGGRRRGWVAFKKKTILAHTFLPLPIIAILRPSTADARGCRAWLTLNDRAVVLNVGKKGEVDAGKRR